MSIKVNLSEALQRLANLPATAEVSGSTVGECVEDLCRQIPHARSWLLDSEGNFRVLVLMNDETQYVKNPRRKITDGSELNLILILCGG